jgi:hypothetical protein
MKSLQAPMNHARPGLAGRAPIAAVLRLRSPRRRLLARRAAVALAAAGALSAPGSAGASNLELQSAYAGPISATNRVCTAEPRALIYGTTNYNAGSALSYTSDGFPGPGYYVPANAPSLLDLEPALLAGARSDLCIGFTLPPDAETPLIRTLADPGDRLQDDPAWPDLPETHVVPGSPGDPAPEGDDPRRITLDLPTGTGLAFAGQTTCSAAQFDAAGHAAATCPAGAQLGEALLRLSVWEGGAARHLPLPAAKVFLLPRNAGELARLGVTVRPLPALAPIKLTFRATLSATGRLRLQADDLPRALYAATDVLGDGTLAPGATRLPTYLESFGLRLWGARDDHPSLASDLVSTTPDCSAPATGTIEVETYAGTVSELEPSALTLRGCSGLDYDPSATITLTDPRPSAPTGATIALAVDGAGSGRVAARTTSTTLTLPAELRLGGQLASGGLTRCSTAAFAATSSAPADCPATSTIGTATIASDLTDDPLSGAIYLTTPDDPADLAGVAIEAAVAGDTSIAAPRLKLLGRLSADDDGRLTLSFASLPTLPLASLTLALRGGERSLLTAPPACGSRTADARLTPTAGSPAELAPAVAIATDCDEPAPAVSTEIVAATARPAARDGLQVTVARTDRSPELSEINARLPQGALVDLRRVARCEPSAFDAGTCDASATLGTVRLRIGVGAAPTTLTAPLRRLTSDDGALATALARVPVELGDLDLGTIDVPVALGFDGTARRLVVAAALPRRAGWFALDVQSIAIDFAAGVAVNPTACGALDQSASATFEGGATASATGALSLSGCAEQPLAPAFRALMSGDSAVGGHPRAALSLTPRPGDANLATLTFALPAGLAVDATRPACEASAFAAGACAGATRIGAVTAASTLADDAVGGELTLVQIPGRALPSIGLSVGGTFGFRALGEVSSTAGRQLVRFSALPDLPLTRLDLVFDGGATGALRIAANLCTAGAAWRLTSDGHGGQSSEAASPVACQSREAGPTVELSVNAKTGLKLKLARFGALRLQSAKLTLSPRLRFIPRAARRRGNAAIAVIGPTTKPTFSSTSLTLSVGAGRAPQEVVARVRWPALTVRPRGHRKTTFRLRLAFADGSVQTRDVLVTLPAKLPASR